VGQIHEYPRAHWAALINKTRPAEMQKETGEYHSPQNFGKSDADPIGTSPDIAR
jgi:hypothetical protein